MSHVRYMNGGFTLIEIIVILTIVMIGIGLFVPAMVTILQTQRTQDSVSDLDVIYRAIVGDPARDDYGYLGDVGVYPTTLLDLVSSAATGWRGPYVTDVELEGNILLDRFGGGIEYFNEIIPNLAGGPGVADCVTLVSKGPDLTSTNLAVNPNVARPCVTAPGPLATSTPYSSDPDNQDNIAAPDFVLDATLLDYDPVGTLEYEISHDDQNPAVAALVPGCPAFNTVTVTSATRGTADELSLAFNQGISIDQVQGLYDVTITPPTGSSVIWRERVAIPPAATVTRAVNLSLDSSTTPTYTLSIRNLAFGATLEIFEFGVSLGTAPFLFFGTTDFTVSGCAPIRVEVLATGAIVEEFTMPFIDNVSLPPPSCPPGFFIPPPCLPNFHKVYPSPVLIPVNVCITNNGTFDDMLTLLQQGLVRGTIHSMGSNKNKCFVVRRGDWITIVDRSGSLVPGGGSFYLVADLNLVF